MNSIAGVKAISAAAVFGAAAVIFTCVPFLIVIIHGIMRARDRSTGGANFLTITLIAFLVHVVSTVSFMGTIFILDIFHTSEPNYFSGKLFEIFWAETSDDVFSAAENIGSSSIDIDRDSNEAQGAYTTLLAVQTISRLLYISLPIVVIMGAAAYGVGLASKDTYRQDYLTVIIYAGVSMVCAATLYVAWALIATEGLFMDSADSLYYTNLLEFINNEWRDILGI
jgi:hypothetical protein